MADTARLTRELIEPEPHAPWDSNSCAVANDARPKQVSGGMGLGKIMAEDSGDRSQLVDRGPVRCAFPPHLRRDRRRRKRRARF